MIRPGTVVWLLLVFVVGYAMFQVKYEVMQQEETLAQLNRQITEGRERIRVLDAEWSYLVRPERLNRLAARYLDLSPVGSAQIVALSAIPERSGAPPSLVSSRAAAPSLSSAPAQNTSVRPGAAIATAISDPEP
jgi:cell division protein FtsL